MNASGIGDGRERAGRSDRAETGTTRGLLERLLVPIANETDAEATCTAIRSHLDPYETHLVVAHVIEKTPGYPNKMPFEAGKERADAIFGIVHDSLADEGHRVSTELRYGSNVVEEIDAAAGSVDATAVAFTPQPGRRWTRMLAGDVGYKLITTSRHPVVVFPRSDAGSR